MVFIDKIAVDVGALRMTFSRRVTVVTIKNKHKWVLPLRPSGKFPAGGSQIPTCQLIDGKFMLLPRLWWGSANPQRVRLIASSESFASSFKASLSCDFAVASDFQFPITYAVGP